MPPDVEPPPSAGSAPPTVAVVTDSSIGVDAQAASAMGVSLVPFQLICGDEVLRDGIDVTAEAFFAQLEQMDDLPRTSAPSPGDWLQVFEDCWAGGREVIALTCASTMTASHKSALIAAQDPELPTVVVDTCTAAAGEYLVASAVAALGETVTLVAAEAVAEAVSSRVTVLGTLDRFDFLRRSGRVGAIAAFAAGRLNINPVFRMLDGEAKNFARTRSRSDALDRIVAELHAGAEAHPGELLHVAAMHANCPRDAGRLLEQVSDLAPVETATTAFTPVMGVHTGPGVVGLGWWWEPPEGIVATLDDMETT